MQISNRWYKCAMTDPTVSSAAAQTAPQERISLLQRVIAALCYAGFGPLVLLRLRNREDPYLEHHCRQGLGVLSLLLGIGLLFVVAILFLSYMLVFYREDYQGTALEPGILSAVRKCFLAWLVVWVAGLGSALWGSWWDIPLVWRIARRPKWIKTTAIVWSAVYVVLVVILSFAAHAVSITQEERVPAKVYMVYEDLDLWPHWIFALGFYRIALKAQEVYGPDSVVITPLSIEAVSYALSHGEFVFVGSHGSEKGLLINRRFIGPKKIDYDRANESLKYVYLTGCDSGVQGPQWEAALAPAEVQTFDRLSAIVEHIFWLWITGPSKLAQVAES